MRLYTGQWLKFRLRNDADGARAGALAQMGADVTLEGKLKGIFRAAHIPVAASITRNGVVVNEDTEPIPDRIMLVDRNGHNVPTLVQEEHHKQLGHAEIRNIFFLPESVVDLEPLEIPGELPPGYVGFHNS